MIDESFERFLNSGGEASRWSLNSRTGRSYFQALRTKNPSGKGQVGNRRIYTGLPAKQNSLHADGRKRLGQSFTKPFSGWMLGCGRRG